MTPTTNTASPHPDASREPAGGGLLKPGEALRKARELITPKGAWTTEAFARNDKWQPIGPLEDRAVCWCTLGALRKVTHDDMSVVYIASSIIEQFTDENIPDWNDSADQTHEDVLATFDRAIALAEADENARTSPSPGPAGADGAADGGGADRG